MTRANKYGFNIKILTKKLTTIMRTIKFDHKHKCKVNKFHESVKVLNFILC